MPSLPEEVVITTLGMLWGRGRIAFLEAFITVLAGLLAANLGSVFLGSRLARGLTVWEPLTRPLRSAAVRTALRALRRHGRAVVFVTRFTPLVRSPVYVAAGMAQIGRRRTRSPTVFPPGAWGASGCPILRNGELTREDEALTRSSRVGTRLRGALPAERA